MSIWVGNSVQRREVNSMVEKLQLWQIVKGCRENAWLSGATFVNTLGQEIYFDGEKIRGVENVDINSEWDYVTTADWAV